jgi:type IV secretion system protein VirB6
MGDLGTYTYFVLIYNYLQHEIDKFQSNTMANMMIWVSGLALTLVTLWIIIQGYRMVTGQSQRSMMAMVSDMARIVLIVTAATTMGIAGTDISKFLSANGTLASGISSIVAGTDSPISEIDRNMAATQLTLAAIDVVQIAPGDTETAGTKARAEFLAGFGAGGPAMAAGAMLLMYQFTMAIFIGLGPLFIMCLIFDQTKELFKKWLMFGIGTMFSIAMLCVVTSIVLGLTERVAAAMWTSSVINSITGMQAEGFSSQALQQGGIGLLMTVLIISVPPMTARFFGDTVGSFMQYSAFGSARPGPQGQPPGSYGGTAGGGSGGAPQQYSGNDGGGARSGGAFTSSPTRVATSAQAPSPDAVKMAAPRGPVA